MTGQPNATPQDDNPDLTESLLDVKPKNKYTFRNPLKPSIIPKLGKPKIEKPAAEKIAVRVPQGRPMKRVLREPGEAPRVAKPGLVLATTAQQRKLIPAVGLFLLLGAVSLYVNFSNSSSAKPVTAFVGPGPGQVGYIPAPGTMNTNTGSAIAGTATGAPPTPATPGSASAGYLPGTPGTASIPIVGNTSSTGTGSGVTVSTTPPPATATGSAPKTAQSTAGPGSVTSKAGAATQITNPGSGKPGTTAGIPGAPGSKPTGAATDVPTEPVIPDVFSAADGGKGDTGSTGNTGRSSTGSTNSGGGGQFASGVTVATQPASLRNVPLAAVPRQVQIAQAAPLSIQSLPAPATPPPPVRAIPTMSAVPVALPRVVMAQVIPPVAQSMPLAAPVTMTTPSGVTLTRGTPATTSTTPAPSVVLVGTASGETPTAILATPDGQMIAGLGDHVTVNSLDYTISKINATNVILTHLKDTLTLTETN